MRQVNKSEWRNYFLFLIFFFCTRLEKSIQLETAWGSFKHRHSLGFVSHVSPKQGPPFMHLQMMHWDKDQKSAPCTIYHSMWLPSRPCTEKSPETAHLGSAAFGRLWVLHKSDTNRSSNVKRWRSWKKWHCFTCSTYLFQLHVLTTKFWNLIFYQLFSLLFYSFWNIN